MGRTAAPIAAALSATASPRVPALAASAGSPALTSASPALASLSASPALRIDNGSFLLHGVPLQIVCGELHYPRIPRAAWRARLDMARAMGLNTIATYVFWNVHEPQPGTYDFAGAYDLAAFVREAQRAGLHVILRAGPYVCAEWDLGGLPAWLLADDEASLRTSDERFMAPVRRWLARLGTEITPLLAGNGGPIIAIQIENEYGSFGNDRHYLHAIYDAFRTAGLTTELSFTADGPNGLAAGSIPGIVPFVNAASPHGDLPALAAFAPRTAMMCSEYYPGWFDHWGEPHHLTSARDAVDDVGWMLTRGASINLYVFCGGSSFGFWSGANANADIPYQPTTTSYDYDAPLDEGGAPTEKYHRLREVIVRTSGPAPAVPRAPSRIAIAPFALDAAAAYADLFAAPIALTQPRHMESLGQSFGAMFYRTRINGPLRGELAFGDVRDYAVVSVDATIIGTLDRRLRERSLAIDVSGGSHDLGVFVESTGRINYGATFGNDRKGLIGPATINGRALDGWNAFCLPMHDLHTLRFGSATVAPPAFYRGTFALTELGDTYLDVRMLGKGSLWVNGKNAGRFWHIGPQYSLFIPREWLRLGTNEVIVFDLIERSARRVAGNTSPIFAPISE